MSEKTETAKLKCCSCKHTADQHTFAGGEAICDLCECGRFDGERFGKTETAVESFDRESRNNSGKACMYVSNCEATSTALDKANDRIAELENQIRELTEWNYCENGLPETWNQPQGFERYLATVEYSDGSTAVRVCEYNGISGWWYEMNKGVKVIAWKHLPQSAERGK